MKKNLFRSAMLFMFTVSLGCSSNSDSGEQCQTIVCQNGGSFSVDDCSCHCPDGYTGTNCDTKVTPTKITISKIRVKMFPNTDAGEFWDFNGLADIYLQMDRQSGTSTVPVYVGDTFYEDVSSDGSNYFDFDLATPIQITQVTTGYTLELLDYDGADTPSSEDDSMGVIAFYPYIEANGFPAILSIKDDSIPLRFELTLSYEW